LALGLFKPRLWHIKSRDEHEMQILDNLKSTLTAFRASALLGQGFRERDQGNFFRAHELAFEGLALLRRPYVRRQWAAEGSALASLTVLAEEVREKSNGTGPTQEDLADTIDILKRFNTEQTAGLTVWLPHLERRYAVLASKS
jgi:hypothetical protein